MAKPTAYTAEHQGFTFTRKSHRTYTHAVLVAGSLDADRARCERDARRNWHTNVAYHQALADGTSTFLARKSWETEDQHSARVAKEQADSSAWLEGGEAGLVERLLAQHDARAAKVRTLDDGDTYFTCAGWCGRLDLAGKLAGSRTGAVIVEAVTK